MSDPLSPIISFAPETIATATLVVETGGQAFTDITREAMRFIKQTGAKDGALFIFMRHTSASLVIQENADPDVRIDLVSALDRLARDVVEGLPAGLDHECRSRNSLGREADNGRQRITHGLAAAAIIRSFSACPSAASRSSQPGGARSSRRNS